MNIEGLIRNAGNGTDSNEGDRLSNAALMEDEEMIEGAVAHLRPTIEGAVTRAIDEVGDFLFQWFFASSFERYRNTHEGHVSLDAVLAFCGSVELWVGRTYLYNALRLAAFRGRLAEVGPEYHQLSPSHRIEVLRLDSDADIAEISNRAFREGFTVLEVRKAVSAKLGIEEPPIGPLVLRAVKAFNKGSADPTTGELILARPHFDYLTPGSWAQAKLSVSTARSRLEVLDEILGEQPPPPRPRRKKGEETAPKGGAKRPRGRRPARKRQMKKGATASPSQPTDALFRRRNEPVVVAQPTERTVEKVDPQRAAPITERRPEVPAPKAETPPEVPAQKIETQAAKVETPTVSPATVPATVVLPEPAPVVTQPETPAPVEETGTEARERFVENLAKEQADLGVRQLVILKIGAGPCAHPRPKAASRFRVFELDVDAGDGAWAAAAADGFDAAKPALVLAIGVCMYKKPSFFSPIYRKVALMAAGSTLAMTFVLMSGSLPFWACHEYREVELAAIEARKPFKASNPKGIERSCELMGLHTHRLISFVDLENPPATPRTGPARALMGEHILVASQ